MHQVKDIKSEMPSKGDTQARQIKDTQAEDMASQNK